MNCWESHSIIAIAIHSLRQSKVILCALYMKMTFFLSIRPKFQMDHSSTAFKSHKLGFGFVLLGTSLWKTAGLVNPSGQTLIWLLRYLPNRFQGWLDYWMCYRMGPPSDVCWFVYHEITPMNTMNTSSWNIYHKPSRNWTRARWPSCSIRALLSPGPGEFQRYTRRLGCILGLSISCYNILYVLI